MATCISHSAEATEAVGREWAQEAQAGWVIGLCGDLGAGKTRLVKGFARGLGITERVLSPTFALVNIYSSGRLPLFHLDLYRLDTVEQIVGAGLEEYLRSAGVTVIEWADKWLSPAGALTRPAGTLPRSEGERDGARGIGDKRGTGAGLVSGAHKPAGRVRWVQLEVVGDRDRRISYEDFGA